MENLNFTFGLPPDNWHPDTNTVIRNSMPLAKIYPGVPVFKQGTDLFTRGGFFEPNSSDNWAKNKRTLAFKVEVHLGNELIAEAEHKRVIIQQRLIQRQLEKKNKEIQ